jgi:hypothetical protein
MLLLPYLKTLDWCVETGFRSRSFPDRAHNHNDFSFGVITYNFLDQLIADQLLSSSD